MTLRNRPTGPVVFASNNMASQPLTNLNFSYISGHTLNKFLYDFLNHRIAGQLLLKLIIARTDSILQSHAPRIAEAGYFFQKLSSEPFK
jgi:hypothetical protein